jgi:acetoin utilization protein AcuC
MYSRLHDLAHEVCEGKWVATGGGGYSMIEVVPRTWTRLVAEAVGLDLDPATLLPEEWRAEVLAITGRAAPTTLGDAGAGAGSAETDPTTRAERRAAVEAAVRATRAAVYPAWGLPTD